MIVVTGGLGYLGGRIASHALTQGQSIRIGSSRVTPSIPEALRGCECMYINVSDLSSLQKVCEGASHVIHLASLNATQCNDDPTEAHRINVLGTKNILQAAQDSGCSNFVYVSTAHVYGSPLQGNLNEDSPKNPTHPYAVTHLEAEQLVIDSGDNATLDTTILRLTNAVGSPIAEDANCWMLVVNDICRQIALSKKVQLRSSPSILRDYVPISSVCEIVLDILQNNKCKNDVLNVSSGKSITLQELMTLISERSLHVLGVEPSIHFEQSAQETQPLHISNERLRSVGCNQSMDISAEIDVHLQNCATWFTGSES